MCAAYRLGAGFWFVLACFTAVFVCRGEPDGVQVLNPLPDQLPIWYQEGQLMSSWLAQAKSNETAFEPGKHALPGTQGIPTKWFGQEREDRYGWYHMFYKQRHGIFVEIGGMDGKKWSNSLFYEQMGWRGMVIEADQRLYTNLTKNRPEAITVNAAVCDRPQQVHFAPGIIPEVGGIYEFMSDRFRHIWLHNDSVPLHSLPLIPCNPLKDLLSRYNFDRVNYMVIDVEGAEWAIVQSIDFSAVTIDVLVVELDGLNVTRDSRVMDFLLNNGYLMDGATGRKTWFVRKGFQPSRDSSLERQSNERQWQLRRKMRRPPAVNGSIDIRFHRQQQHHSKQRPHMIQRPTMAFPKPANGTWAYFIGVNPKKRFFLHWALASIQSLRASNTIWDIAVFVEGADELVIELLQGMNVTRIIQVEQYLFQLPLAYLKDIWDANLESEGSYFHAWNKLLAWTLTDYEKVVAIDPDIMAWDNADSVFYYPELAAVPDQVWPLMSEDFVEYFNTGLMVIEPSLATFARMTQFLGNFKKPVYFFWDSSEQTFLNYFFNGSWYQLPASYNYIGFFVNAAMEVNWNVKWVKMVHNLRESQFPIPADNATCATTKVMSCVSCCQILVKHRDDALDYLTSVGIHPSKLVAESPPSKPPAQETTP